MQAPWEINCLTVMMGRGLEWHAHPEVPVSSSPRGGGQRGWCAGEDPVPSRARPEVWQVGLCPRNWSLRKGWGRMHPIQGTSGGARIDMG